MLGIKPGATEQCLQPLRSGLALTSGPTDSGGFTLSGCYLELRLSLNTVVHVSVLLEAAVL